MLISGKKSTWFLRAQFICLAVLLAIAGFFYVSCDSYMGMGPVVDTISPTIYILEPQDNEFIRGVVVGAPVYLSGLCSDDFGIKELRVTLTNTTDGSVVAHNGFKYKIEDDAWNASLYLPGDGTAEYRVKIAALDSFGNEGADEVIIRVDIIAPWVEEANVIRHSRFESGLKEISFYDDLNYSVNKAYKEIKFENIDDFQNEAFNLELRINFNLDTVAASRLVVLDKAGNPLDSDIIMGDDGNLVNPQDGLVPLQGSPLDRPKWKITGEQIAAWTNGSYDKGAHFIQFMVLAWNSTSWDAGANNGKGGTVAGEIYRIQRINGTCWYPESDFPHIRIEDSDISAGFIMREPGSDIAVEFYDDDMLNTIYAALITKEAMDDLRGDLNEADFLASLADNDSEREKVIADLSLSAYPVNGPNGRCQTVRLPAGAEGEYRLIAFAFESKTGNGLDTVNDPKWTVHPPLKVFIQSTDAPLIIVENPVMEHIFPELTDGRKFSISGFSIDNAGVEGMQIAWVPNASGISVSDAYTTLRDARDGKAPVNGIKIWSFDIRDKFETLINGNKYYRNNFSHEFDIVEDFIYNNSVENANKLFIIHAWKGKLNVYKTFSLRPYTTQPVINVTYPYRDLQVHDTKQDLTLRMSVNHPIGLEKVTITDITVNNNDPDRELTALNYSGGEYQRTLTKESIEGNSSAFYESARVTYRFYVKDILNNEQIVDRTIIMSNLPALMYITSSNSTGIYGISAETKVKLRFEAVFSMPVRVNKGNGSGPRLKLFFANPSGLDPAADAYANYVDPDTAIAGNTVIFEYEILKGHKAPLLYTSGYPIDLNGSKMTSIDAAPGDAVLTVQPGNGLHDRVSLEVDGIYPKIIGAGFTQPTDGSRAFYNMGKTVTLELYTSKQVRISGTPSATIGYNPVGGTLRTAQAGFSKVSHADGKSALLFTWTVNADNVPQTQLYWNKALKIDTSSITDMAGNPIDISAATLNSLSANDLNGANNGNKTAYIVTKAPVAPAFTLYSALAGNQPTTALPAHGRANKDIYIVINRNGASNTTMYYSLEAGNNEKIYSGSPNYETIADADKAHKDSSSYIPSEYKVTAWQVDYAGNRSPNAVEKSVTINSRAPELVDITCTEPNGSYSTGKELTFKVIFSRKVKVNGAGAKLILTGTASEYKDSLTIDLIPADNPTAGTALAFKQKIPAGYRLKNIRATGIVLTGVTDDDFGNTLKQYTGAAAEDANRRPINISGVPNLDRDVATGTDGLVIDSIRPVIKTYRPGSNGASGPAAIAVSGQYFNGGLIGSNDTGVITLTFDKNVWAQSGKTITIRPYGAWALPPILTVEEMDALYNSSFPAIDAIQNDNAKSVDEYRKRLQWRNPNGLAAIFAADLSKAFELRTKYNSYINTTNGIKNDQGNLARPDISSKWVLAFDRDLYDGTNVQLLRNVFNAAKWKWQEISVTSGLVVVNNNTVTITLPEPLQKGRIWEVLIDDDSFRDAAGNPSAEIAAGSYRFWSRNTEEPVIRVDRYSHGENYHGLPASYRGDYKIRPYIDTKVRIDCETPGATIRYDTVRTKYTLKDAFSNNDNSVNFFNHDNIKNGNSNDGAISGANPAGNKNTGYQNNFIGNGGSHPGGSQKERPMQNGFFVGLLTPNKDETGGTTDANMVSQNGAVLWSVVQSKGTGLISNTNLSSAGRAYRTINSNGTASYPASVFEVTAASASETATGRFFYAGDAYVSSENNVALHTNREASGDNDARLFTGRRDYIASAAKKPEVTSGTTAGPVLDVSSPAYEGVFKTTVLYREPGRGLYWLTLQGFDQQPMTPSTPGFPLQEHTEVPPAPYNKIEHTYFSRQAYRVNEGAISGISGTRTNGTWPTGNATGSGDNSSLHTNNNHIWVSWDIVCDWYFKGRNRGLNDNGRLQRAGMNYGAALATYGSVSYRWRQHFDSSVNVNQATK